MAEKVGPTGRVYAVDIQPLAMETVARKAGRIEDFSATIRLNTGRPDAASGSRQRHPSRSNWRASPVRAAARSAAA